MFRDINLLSYLSNAVAKPLLLYRKVSLFGKILWACFELARFAFAEAFFLSLLNRRVISTLRHQAKLHQKNPAKFFMYGVFTNLSKFSMPNRAFVWNHTF